MPKKPRKPHLPHEGGPFYWGFPPWKTREAPLAPSEVPWCTRGRLRYDGTEGNILSRGRYAAFRKVRCPKCGRRLQLMTVDIESGYGDFWPYLPPHKIRALKVPKPRRKMREGKRSRGR